MAALLTGDLDYYSVVAVGVRAATQGLPIRLVACYLPTPPNVLVARPEFKSVKELKGKTIAVSVFGNPPHVVGQMILRHYGLDPEKEVKFVAAGQGNESRLARMNQGLVEAAVVSPPFDFVGKKMASMFSPMPTNFSLILMLVSLPRLRKSRRSRMRSNGLSRLGSRPIVISVQTAKTQCKF
jgi:hypothetical protein